MGLCEQPAAVKAGWVDEVSRALQEDPGSWLDEWSQEAQSCLLCHHLPVKQRQLYPCNIFGDFLMAIPVQERDHFYRSLVE